MSGSYPNTSNLIPTEFEIIVQTKKKGIYGSLLIEQPFLRKEKDKNIIKMKVENKEMIINSYASEIGKTEERVFY